MVVGAALLDRRPPHFAPAFTGISPTVRPAPMEATVKTTQSSHRVRAVRMGVLAFGATLTLAAAPPESNAAPQVVAPAAAPVVAPKHYVSADHGFEFDYPADWTIYTASDAEAVQAQGTQNMVVGITQPGSHLHVRLAITVETGGPEHFSDAEYRSYAQALDARSSNFMRNFQKISDRIISIGGAHALEYVFKYDPNVGTGMDQIRQISVVRGGKAISLSCGAPPAQVAAANKAFDQVVSTFKLQ